MKTRITILCVAIVGCGWDRDFTEYRLDEKSFDAEAMADIERESGIDVPDGAKGLKFHHVPPIDPIVFAKIQIPAASQELMIKQIKALTFSGTEFPKDVANERCDWWPSTFENVLVSGQEKQASGLYVEAYLVKEGDHIILYIKYFTF